MNMTEKRFSGFTLIETLIYLALFAIIIGGTVVVTYDIIAGSDNTQIKVVISEEGNFLLRKIDWALTGVASIDSPAAGASGVALSVTKLGLPAGQNPLVFDLNSGNLRLKRGAGSAMALNSSNATVSNLVFAHLAAIGQRPEAVKASFKLNGQPFEITKYLRK